MNNSNSQIIDNQINHTIQFDDRMNQSIAEISYWSNFVANIGIIFCVFFIINSLLIEEIYLNTFIKNTIGNSFDKNLMVIPAVIVSIIYLIPLFFLKKFSYQVQKAVKIASQQDMVESFNSLKKCYQILGYVTLTLILIVMITNVL